MQENGKETNSYTKKVRLWFYISGAFFILSVVLAVSVSLFLKRDKASEKDVFTDNDSTMLQEEQQEKNFARLIDGIFVTKNNVNPPVVGVMIDNHTDARPPAGIEKANLVFEAEAEGGITRYLAFFTADKDVEEIGPIRSARPYYIDWAQEIGALYTHVGGSPAALVKMEKESIFHINEFYNGSYFWRDEEYFAPHNVFSSLENLKEYLNRNEVERTDFEAWLFVDEKELEDRSDIHKISIDYARDQYEVEWKYDKDNNNYIRFIAGEPHQTKNNEIITAKNIAIMYVDSEEIDDKLRLEMESIGNGDAIVCHQGGCIEGVWEKSSKKARTYFYYENGEKIEFVRGNTWVEVVKPGYEISY